MREGCTARTPLLEAAQPPLRARYRPRRHSVLEQNSICDQGPWFVLVVVFDQVPPSTGMNQPVEYVPFNIS